MISTAQQNQAGGIQFSAANENSSQLAAPQPSMPSARTLKQVSRSQASDQLQNESNFVY